MEEYIWQENNESLQIISKLSLCNLTMRAYNFFYLHCQLLPFQKKNPAQVSRSESSAETFSAF